MAHTIKHIVEHLFENQKGWKAQLLQSWPEIVGNIGTKVSLEKIHDDSLVLGVSDSCWLQELYMLSPVLLRIINKKLDYPRIKHIRFKKIGIKKTKVSQTKKQKRVLRTRLLSQKEERSLKSISDPDLQKALKSFLYRCNMEE